MIKAYVELTKPRIVELLLITTVPTMIVAERRLPSLWLMLATVAGGTLAAGGANVLNCYIDRDIDQVMNRTKGRPLPEGRIKPRSALVFGVVLEVIAFVELWLAVNLLSAILAVSATAFYVGVYTLWLKRRSVENIVVGGAAGAVPVLVGWAAVTGTVALEAWVMFAIIFFWTPPHFWALAVKYRDDYRQAGVPMLPAVRSLSVTVRRVLVYTVLLMAVSLAMPLLSDMGAVYTGSAIVLGAVFMFFAVQLFRRQTVAAAMRLFGWSITYLGLLFVSMAVDSLVVA